MRKSLGDKRHEISPEQIKQIVEIHRQFREGEHSKIFKREAFGFRKVTIERPLRLNFQANKERLMRLNEQKAFADLAQSKKKAPKERNKEIAEGVKQQKAIFAMLSALPAALFKDRGKFEKELDKAVKVSGFNLSAPLRKAILAALSERDEAAEICRDDEGNPEPDSDLRDTENVPLGEDINAYFDREVKPHVPDAWVNTALRDHKDGEVGKVGYEINFNRYFYKYQPPRPLEEIESDIETLEKEIMGMLSEVTR